MIQSPASLSDLILHDSEEQMLRGRVAILKSTPMANDFQGGLNIFEVQFRVVKQRPYCSGGKMDAPCTEISIHIPDPDWVLFLAAWAFSLLVSHPHLQLPGRLPPPG